MTINENNYAIAMTRGDSESLTVRKKDDVWVTGETITLTVREDADGDILFQKAVSEFDDEGAAVIAIDPADTEGIDFGSYVYDIQYSNDAGTVTTLIPPSPGKLPKFKLTEEATY